jgi:HD-GYP domain-containing protein (c-di-GMP phosphodiesterase class II)
MGRPRSEYEINRAGIIMRFTGDLEAFLTEYAEQHQFRSVQELLTMLLKQYMNEHEAELPAELQQPTNERRVNIKPTSNLEDFLARYAEAYDYPSKAEVIKHIAREFYQAQQPTKRKG